MSPQDNLDDFMDRLVPLTSEEKTELLLMHLAVMLDTLEESEVATMRQFVHLNCPAGPGRDTLEELLDGHLMLRQLRAAGLSEVE